MKQISNSCFFTDVEGDDLFFWKKGMHLKNILKFIPLKNLNLFYKDNNPGSSFGFHKKWFQGLDLNLVFEFSSSFSFHKGQFQGSYLNLVFGISSLITWKPNLNP
jgi:hypothetical protein